MKPIVVNCTRECCTHYCGRPGSLRKALGSPIDMSILGNPFPMLDEGDRNNVVIKYREWLWAKCKRESDELEAIRSIPLNAVLGCFCAPRACHCDIIANAVQWARSEQ